MGNDQDIARLFRHVEEIHEIAVRMAKLESEVKHSISDQAKIATQLRELDDAVLELSTLAHTLAHSVDALDIRLTGTLAGYERENKDIRFTGRDSAAQLGDLKLQVHDHQKLYAGFVKLVSGALLAIVSGLVGLVFWVIKNLAGNTQ